jgi:hypothetical protein
MDGNKRVKEHCLALCIAWALLPGAALAVEVSAKATAVSPGQSLYVKHCYSCHDDPKYDLGHINRSTDPTAPWDKIVSIAPMKYLNNLSITELQDIAAYIASIPASTILYPVVEYYHTTLDHYFITGDPNELAYLDSTDLGWQRTGYTFKSSGSTPVCRFYGSISPGPNSHFYTVSATECENLKQLQASTPPTLPRWNLESVNFYSTPVISGVCPGGTLPVYRAYNNGTARGIASNHRISTSQAAIKEVVARGWIDEGTVMCATATK